MKKSTILYFVFVFSVVTSCHKKEIDVVVNKDMSTQEMLVNYLLKQKDITTTSANFIDTLMVKANWSNISSTSISKEVSLYYVPLVYNSNNTGLSFLYNNNTHQVYYSLINEIPKNTSTNIAHGTVASVNRPIDVIAGFYKYNMNGYTGSIRAYNLSNNLLWEYGYENGVTKFEKWVTSSSDVLPSSSSAQIKSSSIASKSVKANGCLDWYLVTWYDDGSSDWKFIGTTCDGNCLESIGIAKDSTMIKSNCNGTGGGGGSSPTYKIITNNISDPCLKQLISNLQKSNKLTNAIGAILQDVFGIQNSIQLTFNQNDNLKNNRGQTDYGQAYQDPNDNNKYFVILNALELNKFSQERKTLTIMHEILHNYFDYEYLNSFKISFPNDHTQILNKYIDKMANSLEDIFPGLKAHHDLTLALCYDDLQSSVGGDILNKGQILPDDFEMSIISHGLNIGTWQALANQIKSNDSEFATQSPCGSSNKRN